MSDVNDEQDRNRLKKFTAIVKKEFLQVFRDLPGLILLFLMPAVMLIIITITQENQIIGLDSGMKILLVNADSGIFGNTIERELMTDEHFTCRIFKSEKEAEKAVSEGQYQILLTVPPGATDTLKNLARRHASDTSRAITGDNGALTGIRILYDPAVMKIYKEMLVSSLQMILESTAIKVYMESYTTALRTSVSDQMETWRRELTATDFDKEIPDFPGRERVISSIRAGMKNQISKSVNVALPGNYSVSESLVTAHIEAAGENARIRAMNLVNNNVPAFILFAMFFIVVPLAGSIINEKLLGTRDRMMTLPVTRLAFFSGKITVFFAVCLLQFILMIAIGRYVLPLASHLPALSLHVNIPALAAITIASSLAAIGFGLLIGTVTSTFGQAAPLGSVLVVILAILGGIFVPNYMMPNAIRQMSIISPLHWGTDAFFSIFARGVGLGSVWTQFLSLLGFFAISLTIAVVAFTKRK
jgi:ABC-2 type transport system permease protein